MLNPDGALFFCENSRMIGNVRREDPGDIYFSATNQAHRDRLRKEQCPGCLSPCQINVSAIKRVLPYVRFSAARLVREGPVRTTARNPIEITTARWRRATASSTLHGSYHYRPPRESGRSSPACAGRSPPDYPSGRPTPGCRAFPTGPATEQSVVSPGSNSLWQESAILARPDRSSFVQLTAMAMGKRPAARQAAPMWVDTGDLPTSDGHPFFERVNRVLEGGRLRRLRRGIVRGVLRCADGPPEVYGRGLAEEVEDERTAPRTSWSGSSTMRPSSA